MSLRDYAFIAVVASAAVLYGGWRIAIWYGAMPCNHAC